MKIKESILKKIYHKDQEKFKEKTTEIVCESFIFTGDRDYITARFAFFQNQSHLFLWSSAQALEKYMKAHILLLGKGSIARTHDLNKLSKEVCSDFLDFDLSIPDLFSKNGIENWPTIDRDGFLTRITENGAPNVRYDQIKLDVHLQDLVFLDRLAFKLRHNLVEDKVIECKTVGNKLKEYFFNLNFPFAPADHKHPELNGLRYFHTTVTTLEAALNGIYGHKDIYEEWAKDSMDMRSVDHLFNKKQSDFQ